MESEFESPERAAKTGFPERYCRVVASRVHGDDAFVLLSTNTRKQAYILGQLWTQRQRALARARFVQCFGWLGTDRTQPGRRHGLPLGAAPEGADMVRIHFQSVAFEEPVTERAFLFVRFQMPCDLLDRPDVEAFRVNGVWRRCAELCWLTSPLAPPRGPNG